MITRGIYKHSWDVNVFVSCVVSLRIPDLEKKSLVKINIIIINSMINNIIIIIFMVSFNVVALFTSILVDLAL